jgi:hypothetical protein
VMVGDPQQRTDLVHAGQDGHLLGHDLVQAAPAQDRCGVLLDPAPVARDVEEDVRLLRPEVRRDLQRRRTELAAEGVAQAVRDVGGHHDRPVAPIGAGQRGGRGDARLADAALAGVHEDAGHADRRLRCGTSILPVRSPPGAQRRVPARQRCRP